MLAFRAGKVVGVGCLFRRPDLAHMLPLISMVGPTIPTLGDAREVTAALVVACLEIAERLGSSLEAEADDANASLVDQLETMGARLVGTLNQLADG